VLYLFIGLIGCELVLKPFGSLYSGYSQLIGYLGLAIEATLPLPQVLTNHKAKSCKGFRLSVLASWLAGDFMKMLWFFTSPTEIPWSFKLCGMFQTACDSYLGIQYAMYGSGETKVVPSHLGHSHDGLAIRANGGARSPFSAPIPLAEKDQRLD
jgi:hypothetical protein